MTDQPDPSTLRKPRWLQRSDDAIDGLFAKIRENIPPSLAKLMVHPMIWFALGYWMAPK